MQVKHWVIGTVLGASFLWTACNQAGSSKENGDSTTVSTKTDQTTTKRTVQVPEATRTSFEAKYPQASDVVWNYHDPVVEAPIEWDWTGWPTVDTTDYVANFKVNDDDYWVWYDYAGNWIATVSEVKDYSGLPPAVNNVIKTEYPEYKIKSIDKENDKNRTAYEVQMENGEDKVKLLIGENGMVMKRKGKINGEKFKEKNNPKDSAR